MVAGSASEPGERGLTDRAPAWTLAVAAMLSVQVAAALSTHLFDTVGPAGTAWLRLTFGAVVFLAISRPQVRTLSRSDVGTVLALGIAVAIEFLGPRGVAVFHGPDRRRLIWPALALAGVVLLTEPWQGAIDPV